MKMSKQQKPVGSTGNKKIYHNPDEFDWDKKHGLSPMEAVKSATARLQSALQREKERRQSRERLGQELLNPKKPEPKQIPVSEDVQNIMDALINKIVVNEAISNIKR